MKLKTDHWEDDNPEKRVKPWWTMLIVVVMNLGYFIFYNDMIGIVGNAIFMVIATLPIISYNKYRKDKDKESYKGDGTGGSKENRQKESSKENKEPIS